MMQNIKSYVFFDLETTGLPHQERNCTRITELCFVVVSRKDIEITNYGTIPPNQKLSLLFNPEKEINPNVAKLTGLSNDYLKNCPPFKEKIDTIKSFLQDLQKPICLVAHNGNNFDFKLLLTEFNAFTEKLPDDLLCVDSLIGFRKLLKGSNINYTNLRSGSEIFTDDEDEWPALNVSKEDWSDIDKLDCSFSEIGLKDVAEIALPGKTLSVKRKPSGSATESYSLAAVYKRLLNKTESSAHRAEADCMMLVNCVVAIKHLFLPWADDACKNLSEIKPYIPY